MKKIYFPAVLMMVILITTSALAGDYDNVQPYKPYRWTGFTFGFQGAFIAGNSEWKPDSTNQRFKHNTDGWVGGFYIGYQYQMPFKLVVGIETETNYGRVSGSSSCPNTNFSCHSDIHWIGSTRGKFGYALGRFMPYATIGWAYAGVDTYTRHLPTGRESGSTNSYLGWTPGVGLDIAVTDNFLIRGEYTYYDLGRREVTIDNVDTEIRLTNHAFKFGMGFKF